MNNEWMAIASYVAIQMPHLLGQRQNEEENGRKKKHTSNYKSIENLYAFRPLPDYSFVQSWLLFIHEIFCGNSHKVAAIKRFKLRI